MSNNNTPFRISTTNNSNIITPLSYDGDMDDSFSYDGDVDDYSISPNRKDTYLGFCFLHPHIHDAYSQQSVSLSPPVSICESNESIEIINLVLDSNEYDENEEDCSIDSCNSTDSLLSFDDSTIQSAGVMDTYSNNHDDDDDISQGSNDSRDSSLSFESAVQQSEMSHTSSCKDLGRSDVLLLFPFYVTSLPRSCDNNSDNDDAPERIDVSSSLAFFLSQPTNNTSISNSVSDSHDSKPSQSHLLFDHLNRSSNTFYTPVAANDGLKENNGNHSRHDTNPHSERLFGEAESSSELNRYTPDDMEIPLLKIGKSILLQESTSTTYASSLPSDISRTSSGELYSPTVTVGNQILTTSHKQWSPFYSPAQSPRSMQVLYTALHSSNVSLDSISIISSYSNSSCEASILIAKSAERMRYNRNSSFLSVPQIRMKYYYQKCFQSLIPSITQHHEMNTASGDYYNCHESSNYNELLCASNYSGNRRVMSTATKISKSVMEVVCFSLVLCMICILNILCKDLIYKPWEMIRQHMVEY